MTLLDKQWNNGNLNVILRMIKKELAMITGKKDSIMDIHFKIRLAWDFVAPEFTDRVRDKVPDRFVEIKTRGDVDKIVEWLRKVVSKSKGAAKLRRQTALRIYKRMLDRLYMM